MYIYKHQIAKLNFRLYLSRLKENKDSLIVTLSSVMTPFYMFYIIQI